MHVYRNKPIVMTGTAVYNAFDCEVQPQSGPRPRPGRSVYLIQCPDHCICPDSLSDLYVSIVGRASTATGLDRIAKRVGAEVASYAGI